MPDRLLVVDSASSDDTVSLARAAGFEIISISRAAFNHGGTRSFAAEQLPECEVIVFLTQDAVLAAPNALTEIVRCFADITVAVAYGRQLPHRGASPIAAHSRYFNYGSESLRKDLAAAREVGAKVYFCSNSFAAYRSSVLRQLGGFRRDLILGEDMEFAARAIMIGYANYYCADALVQHSHEYSIRQTLARYFDIGVFDSENRWMRQQFGSHSGEGIRFVRSELHYLLERDPSSIPAAIMHTAAKWMGYRLGRLQRRLPIRVRRLLSMMPDYWR